MIVLGAVGGLIGGVTTNELITGFILMKYIFYFVIIDMAGLPNNTFMSPGVSFYATTGGAAATLQSPVAIIPDGTGNTVLGLVAGGTSGSSVLAITGADAVPGGPGSLIVGGFGVGYRMGVLDGSGILTIEENTSGNPVISYDSQVSHQLILGDGSAVPGASVRTNVPLVVYNSVIDSTGVNGVVITEDSTTSSTITQTCASNGVLFVGSSQANKSTLVIVDIPQNGAANHIEVNGSAGQVPLFISGAQGAGGISYIYPDSSGIPSGLFLGASRNTENTIGIQQTGEQSFVDIGGNGGQGVRLRGVSDLASVQTGIVSSTAAVSGQLQLQGSSGSANTINITDVSAVFDQQIVQQVPGTVTYSPGVILASGTYAPSNTDFSIASYEPGLYMVMMRVNPASITDATTLANMSSGLVYIQKAPAPNDATSIVVGGGTFGNGNVNITPVVVGPIGASSLRLTVTGVTMLISIKMFPLTGVLPGFDV